MSRLIKKIKKAKKVFNLIGLDIVKIAKSPRCSFLGLKNLPIKTIIDIGANTGQFARRAKDIFPNARIYSFEPIPEAFKQLNDLAAGEKTVTAYNFALGEYEGTLEMFKHIEHNPSSSFLKTTKVCEDIWPFTQKQSAVPVKLTTLDKWMERLPVPLSAEILIKLDVQGYEDRVIKGGLKTFNAARACILEIGLDKLYKGQADFNLLSSMLYSFGYRYAGNLEQSYANDGHVIFIDAVFVK